jgi:hypothetical protein
MFNSNRVGVSKASRSNSKTGDKGALILSIIANTAKINRNGARDGRSFTQTMNPNLMYVRRPKLSVNNTRQRNGTSDG